MKEKSKRKNKKAQQEKSEIAVKENAIEQATQQKQLNYDEIYPETWKRITGTEKPGLSLDILLRASTSYDDFHSIKSAQSLNEAMEELKPQNTLEGMLCSQLISLHFLGMDYLRKAKDADRLNIRDSNFNNAYKLLRLQHETIEALAKHRRNGEQKVIVQHVNVGNGGQAVVAGTFEGGGVKKKNDELPHGHSTNL